MDSTDITRREVKGIIKDIEGVENHCFRQILSTATASVFAQIPYICTQIRPFTFQELANIPWNSGQLTKAFLVEYADLICVEGDKKNVNHTPSRLYSSHPGLSDFISDPVRAGVYHHFVRSHFIQIIDQAREGDHFYWLRNDACTGCVSLCLFTIN